MMFFNPKKRKTKKSLADIIGLVLNRETYHEFKNRIERQESLEDLVPAANSVLAQYHRAKLLREECEKQFSHKYRPIIELIMNGVDAKHHEFEGNYLVDVKSNGTRVEIQDSGRGMSIDEILTTLLIPFSTEKDAGRDIGRFGVGFFSSLGYCLTNPKTSSIDVSTTSSGIQYNLSLIARSNSVDDIVCSFEKSRNKNEGTRVRLGVKHNENQLEKYISKYLHFFDPKRAKIRFNGRIINQISKKASNYLVPVETSTGMENCRVSISKAKKKGSNTIYSQGVYVRSESFPTYEIQLDLPSNVLLVEGRDEPKHDENYASVMRAVLGFVCKNSQQLKKDVDKDFDVREFVISLVETNNLAYNQVHEIIEENKEFIFDRDTYIVEDPDRIHSYQNIIDFFGENITSQIYAPANERAYRFWSNFLPDDSSMIENNTIKSQTEINSLIVQSPSLSHLMDKLHIYKQQGYIYPVHLIENSKTKSPFIGDQKRLYINENHPMLKDDSFLARYMASTYLGRLINGEKITEQVIIH